MKGNKKPSAVIAVQNFPEPVLSFAKNEADKVMPMSVNVAEISNAFLLFSSNTCFIRSNGLCRVLNIMSNSNFLNIVFCL